MPSTVARIGRHGIVQHRHDTLIANRWTWPWQYHESEPQAHRIADANNPSWVDMLGNPVIATEDMISEYQSALRGPTSAWRLWNDYTRRGFAIPANSRIPILDSYGRWHLPDGTITMTRPERRTTIEGTGIHTRYTISWTVSNGTSTVVPETETTTSASVANARPARQRANGERHRQRIVRSALSAEARESILEHARERKFGVEIECVADVNLLRTAIRNAGVSVQREDYNHQVRDYWKLVPDGSLNYRGARAGYEPIELVSPPLSGREGMEELERVCQALRNSNTLINRSCGLHVHHDANDLTMLGARAMARNWAHYQNAIDTVLAPSRRGSARNSYCMPYTLSHAEIIDNGRNLRQVMNSIGTRYLTLNYTSFQRHGTIEVRQHQGSIEFSKIAHWIQFGQMVFERSLSGNVFPSTNNFMQALADLEAPAPMREWYTNRMRELGTYQEVTQELVARTPTVLEDRHALSIPELTYDYNTAYEIAMEITRRSEEQASRIAHDAAVAARTAAANVDVATENWDEMAIVTWDEMAIVPPSPVPARTPAQQRMYDLLNGRS